MHSTSTVYLVGSKLDRCVPWIIGTGSSRSMGIKRKILGTIGTFSVSKENS